MRDLNELHPFYSADLPDELEAGFQLIGKPFS
jgi:hypothetical protein